MSKFKVGEIVVHRLNRQPMLVIAIPDEPMKCAKPCEHCEIRNYPHSSDTEKKYTVRTQEGKGGLGKAIYLEEELEKA